MKSFPIVFVGICLGPSHAYEKLDSYPNHATLHSLPADLRDFENFNYFDLNETIYSNSKEFGIPEELEPPEEGSETKINLDTDELVSVSSFQSRRTSETTQLSFSPLVCNGSAIDLNGLNCNNDFKVFLNAQTENDPLTIPCDKCYTLKIGSDETITIPSGLNIEGKLVIELPEEKQISGKTSIFTPFVIVQGYLDLELDIPTISPQNEVIDIVLTGTDDVLFEFSEPNQNACTDGPICNLGPKPFLVAGGQVNILAAPETCPTWTYAKKKIYGFPPPPPTDTYETYKTFPQGCDLFSTSDSNFIHDTFADGLGLWRGDIGTYVVSQDGALLSPERTMPWQGPILDYTFAKPSNCLIPDQTYILTARLKLDKQDGSEKGSPTTCLDDHYRCVKIYSKTGRLESNVYNHRHHITSHKIGEVYNRYAPNYGEYFHIVSTFTLNEDHLNSTNPFHYIQIEGPEEGVDITLDEFRIDLPGASSFPPDTPENVCDDLLYNRDANANGFNPYPHKAYHWQERLEVHEEDGNRFFRLRNRLGTRSFHSKINPACLYPGVQYKVSFTVRIHTILPQKYDVVIRGENLHDKRILKCDAQSIDDGDNGWVKCEGYFTIDDDLASGMSWAAVELITDNHVNRGLYTVDIDEISIRFQEGFVNGIVVDQDVVPCWGAGSRLHVTSAVFYRTYSKTGYEGLITEVQSLDDGTAILMLDSSYPPIQPIITEEESDEFAVEVALLSRNVKIRGDVEVTDSSIIGAHVKILSNSTQVMSGIEFLNMGSSIDGHSRYPVLIKNGNFSGGNSMISKNSLRDSYVRGIVLEETSGLSVNENIVFQVKDHSFFVGSKSSNNTLESNLVSKSRSGSGFYIDHGNNNFIGNVASSSVHNGWQILHQNGDHPMGIFKNNVAHSCNHHGMLNYHYRQNYQLIFDNVRTYKNRIHGFYLYNGYNYTLKGGLFAENGQGIKIDRAYNVHMVDVDIRGISDLTSYITSPPGFTRLCPGTNIFGIQLPTNENPYSINWWNQRQILENIHFSLFDKNQNCEVSSPIGFHKGGITINQWNFLTSLSNVKYEDKPFINACETSSNHKIQDLVITDADGNSNPKGKKSPFASIVSNSARMTTFATEPCTHYQETCTAYCPNLCLRTFNFAIEQHGTENVVLKISKDGTRKSTTYLGSTRVKPDHESYSNDYNIRYYSASLPEGSYDAKFLDTEGNTIWPGFVQESWEGHPQCNGHVSISDVHLTIPESNSCDDIIRNGHFVDGGFQWHTADAGKIEIQEDESINSNILRLYDRKGWWYGLVQNLDNRCLYQHASHYYEIEAHFRLEKEGKTVTCDYNNGNGDEGCPYILFQVLSYKNASLKEGFEWNWPTVTNMVHPIKQDSFNTMHGIFTNSNSLQNARRILMHVRGSDTADIILSSISLKPFNSNICDGNLVKNGDFELKSSKYWKNNNGIISMVDGYDGNGDLALKIGRRTTSSWNLMQYIKATCLQPGDRYAVKAKYKFLKNNDIFRCDPKNNTGEGRCSTIYFYAKDETGEHETWRKLASTVSSNETTWQTIGSIHTVVESQVGITKHHQIWFAEFDQDLDLVVDNISITPLHQDCSKLVENPDFEDGTSSYWIAESQSNQRLEMYSPGAYGSSFALRVYERTHSWLGVYQNLDPRCFKLNQEIEMTASFKLLNVTTSSGETCSGDFGEKPCPKVQLFCLKQSWDVKTFRNEINHVVWDANGFNDFLADFRVTSSLAECRELRVYVGRELNLGLEVIFDNFQIRPKSTFQPTYAPTGEPSVIKQDPPTSIPTLGTNMPTASEIICPDPDMNPLSISSGAVLFNIAGNGKLCTLTKATIDQDTTQIVNVVPIARSYNNNPWETSASSYAISVLDGQEWSCFTSGCQIKLPELGLNEAYHLRSFTYSLSVKNQVARFLESTTFGITRTELESFDYNANIETQIISWVKNQMNVSVVGLTSHREFWRERANSKLHYTTSVGITDHPCATNSRWRTNAFNRIDHRDSNSVLQIVQENSGVFVLKTSGHVRTVVPQLKIEYTSRYKDLYSNYTFNSTFEYTFCATPTRDHIYINLEDGSCQPIIHPKVDFTNHTSYANNYFHLPSDPSLLKQVIESDSYGEDFLLKVGLNSSQCDSQKISTVMGDPPVFAIYNSTWLQFDPHLRFERNSLRTPLSDGGGEHQIISGGTALCSNVERTFLNEETCFLSTESSSCGSVSANDISFTLNEENIRALNLLTGHYVYTVVGLEVRDSTYSLDLPCTPNLVSRWEMVDLCVPTNLTDVTADILREYIRNSNDENDFTKDITFGAVNNCNEADYYTEIDIEVDEQCYRRVHPDYMSVFDMTYWTRLDTHPGNSVAEAKGNENPIKKWFDSYNITTLPFPSSFHPMTRWRDHRHQFPLIGKLGSSKRVRDLPSEMRTSDVVNYFGSKLENEKGAMIVCGSPGESANNKALGSYFDFVKGVDNPTYGTSENRKNVWVMNALKATDQLRQRVAWALSQILVVVTSAINDEFSRSENFLAFYDIFIRNAFGNYRQILKEISYNPLMAENLSFLRSRGAAYVWKREKKRIFADENFAREIMQLFTTGIIQLNMDGSPKLNTKKEIVLVYDNEDIRSFARAWTGFDLQDQRGNIELGKNRIDAMKIDPKWRDPYPKTNLYAGYIGDGYPLCIDFPNKMFLRKGAKYNLLGSRSLPKLMSDPAAFASDGSIKKFELDENSLLRNYLYHDNINNLPISITLNENLSCTGRECDVETVRVVQISNSPDIFYEYVQQPCVQNAFYNHGKKVMGYHRNYHVTCANSKLPLASEACCEIGSFNAVRNQNFDGERMSFELADARCSEIDRESCDYSHFDYRIYPWNSHKIGVHWSSDSCMVKAKINAEGLVAIVYEPSDYQTLDGYVDELTRNYFKVFWDLDSYPFASESCDNICEVSMDGSCICQTYVQSSKVFNGMPKSVEDLFANAYIGSVHPDTYDHDTFSSATDQHTNITAHTIGNTFDENTIFEFHDSKGRSHFLKNSKEIVRIVGTRGEYTDYSFRNAPHFLSLLELEMTVRDAQYETDAVLDHYFYHDNTPPFISARLIQRFGVSNPSPRYINVVALAFASGNYFHNDEKFGTGVYGCLTSTIAAIILDREARDIILDADPSHGSMREPLLKVIAVMRSMEYDNIPSRLVTRMTNLFLRIGQESHEFPTVFSFFLPEFKPAGRVGDAFLVGPEVMLVDMPKSISLLNGLFSLVKYGLSHCYNGFGHYLHYQCHEGDFSSALGILGYGKNFPTSSFTYETFEGSSLVGGFDHSWVGYHGYLKHGFHSVDDPSNTNTTKNHVLMMQGDNFNIWHYRYVFSPEVKDLDSSNMNYVVKFRYYKVSQSYSNGCIGLSEDGTVDNQDLRYMFCDNHYSGQNQIPSISGWNTCQFEIPIEVSTFRIVLSKHSNQADAFFDDIQLVQGSGNTCDGVILDKVDPPGVEGHSKNVVDELSTLLTAGRIDDDTKDIIRKAYDSTGTEEGGIRLAQQLMLTSPEFHSTNPVKRNGFERSPKESAPKLGGPYKAVVYLMLSGGCDSFNMLTPFKCKDGNKLFEDYKGIREQVHLPKSRLQEIPAENQVCESFGIHEDLPILKSLYTDGDLLFFANTGALSKPVDLTNWRDTNIQLFAHNTMQLEAKRVDPEDERSNTGVIGRISDSLSKQGYKVQSFSIDRFSVALTGFPGSSPSPLTINQRGVSNFNADPSIPDMDDIIAQINSETSKDSGFFAETWSDSLFDSMNKNSYFQNALQSVDTDIEFPMNSLGNQLATVSRLLKTRQERDVDRDTFYVEIGGFDTHTNVDSMLSGLFQHIDAAIDSFVQELKAMDLWDNVVLIQTSDFARTLNPNGGDGTDHGWGGNYFMLGGDVRGGQIVGSYPDDLSESAPLNVGRGSMIPTLPWDACFQAIAQWLGVEEHSPDLDYVCPNRHNFESSQLLNQYDVFDLPGGSHFPTISPTSNPTLPGNTSYPSNKPSAKPSLSPSDSPTFSPSTSAMPSTNPSKLPSNQPTAVPSTQPSTHPSNNPSVIPTQEPTGSPSTIPSLSLEPSHLPTAGPSNIPTLLPSNIPTLLPSLIPSDAFTTDMCVDDDSYKVSWRTCSWVRKVPSLINDRCNISDFSKKCRKTCDSRCSSAPSAAPSDVTYCVDDQNWFLNVQKTKGCFWVYSKPSRCFKYGDNCQNTCGQRNITCKEACCKDLNPTKCYNKVKKVSDFQRNKNCKKNFYKYYCQESCGLCNLNQKVCCEDTGVKNCNGAKCLSLSDKYHCSDSCGECN